MQFVASTLSDITAWVKEQLEKRVSVAEAMKRPPGGLGTFARDEGLPALPLPELEHTLERYLESVQPLVPPDQLLRTQAILRDFQTGVGEQLQRELRHRADSRRNWLEDWWVSKAYLENRTPLLPNCCMMGAMHLDDLFTQFDAECMAERAALLIYYMTDMWRLLRTETLAPFVDRDNVFSMHQFRQLFNCTRIPEPQCDRVEAYFKTETEGPCPSHVIVMCGGHFFLVETVPEGQGPMLTPPEWQRQLQHVLDTAAALGPGPGVGRFTCDERDSWARNRKRLEELSADNRRILHLIDTCIQTLILAPGVQPQSPSEVVTIPASLYGSIWADKCSQLLVWGNGHASPFGEHSAYDGSTSVACAFYMHRSIYESGGRWRGSAVVRGREVPLPERLQFVLDDTLSSQLVAMRRQQQINQENLRISSVKFREFGKKMLKKYRVHPDTFVQLALHLSYFRMHGKLASCYETATTRAFYHGRTETLRTCTGDVKTWVESMQSDTAQAPEKVHLLREASTNLVKLMQEAKENAGCDRHLFGLYCSALESRIPVPAIFSDPSYVMSGGGGNYVLSTSLVGYTPIGGVTAPMREDGYGVFYNIMPDEIRFGFSDMRSCPDTDVEKLVQTMFASMREMRLLLQSL